MQQTKTVQPAAPAKMPPIQVPNAMWTAFEIVVAAGVVSLSAYAAFVVAPPTIWDIAMRLLGRRR